MSHLILRELPRIAREPSAEQAKAIAADSDVEALLVA
jgi:hypothetical protein